MPINSFFFVIPTVANHITQTNVRCAFFILDLLRQRCFKDFKEIHGLDLTPGTVNLNFWCNGPICLVRVLT